MHKFPKHTARFLDSLAHPAVVFEWRSKISIGSPKLTNQYFDQLARSNDSTKKPPTDAISWSFLSKAHWKILASSLADLAPYQGKVVHLPNAFIVSIAWIDDGYIVVLFIPLPEVMSADPSGIVFTDPESDEAEERGNFLRQLNRSEMGRLIKNFDWESIESIGPLDFWPVELCRATRIVLMTATPTCIVWGKERRLIYNGAYARLIGELHPSKLGGEERDVQEIVQHFPNLETPHDHMVRGENLQVLIKRPHRDLPMETYVDFTTTPLVVKNEIRGTQWVCVEKTESFLAERRLKLLSELCDLTLGPTSAQGFASALMEYVEEGKRDIPFLAIYTTTTEDLDQELALERIPKRADHFLPHQFKVKSSKQISTTTCDQPWIPFDLSPKTTRNACEHFLEEHIAEAWAKKQPVIVRNVIFPLNPVYKMYHISGVQPTALVIIPFCHEHEPYSVAMMLIVGLNPCVKYNESHRIFIKGASQHISSTLFSIIVNALRVEQYSSLLQRYMNICNTCPTGIFTVNSKGKIDYCNKKFLEVVEGCGHSDDTWPIRLKDKSLYDSLKTDAELVDLEVDLDNKKHVRILLQAVYEDKRLLYYIGCISDRTALRNSELQEQESRERRIQDSDDHRIQLENFIDFVSHELRNPLSGVQQNAECLRITLEEYKSFLGLVKIGDVDFQDITRFEKLLQEDVESLDNILICTSHQTQIANEILNVSKLSAGLFTINPQPFNFVQKVKETLRMFEADCTSQGIQLKTVIGERLQLFDGSLLIRADEARVSQVLINLTSNAVKCLSKSPMKHIVVELEIFSYPPPRLLDSFCVGDELRTSFVGSSDQVWISIAVQDTGRGLTQDALSKVFQRFSQANPETNGTGGAGLGLFISQKFIELHGGFIEVISQPNQGSTFRFALPTPKPDGKALNSPEPTNHPLPQSVHLVREHSLKRPLAENDTNQVRVLLVEDNIINQKVLARQLAMNHMVVSVANNGKEGLEKLQKEDVNAVLLDIEMPVMSGVEAVKHIRRLEAENETCRRVVVAITGNARPSQIIQYKSAGFDDVFVKPYKIFEVVRRIRELCG